MDPVLICKKSLFLLSDEIKKSPRGKTDSGPVDDAAIARMARLLQAGFGALLPVDMREGVSLPVVSSKDPEGLQQAQRNFIDVITSGQNATWRQKGEAYYALNLVAGQLAVRGYNQLAEAVTCHIASKRPRGGDPPLFSKDASVS